MALCLETGYTMLNKVGEELCGDNVDIAVNGDYTTLVLADGLGSGVKANILSTLTSKILCTMISNDIEIYDCIETIIQSLPVCKERQVAYSTFSIIHLNTQGKGYLFEFDNPQAIYINDGKCMDFEREKLEILDKTVYKTELNLKSSDVILVMSDGTIHAGIGMLLNLGWQRKEIMEYLNTNVKSTMSAKCIACLLASACNDLYLDKPGDDTTVAAVKLREKVAINIMVGPPIDMEKDEQYISEFINTPGKHVVCGGTSSQIVAKFLGEEISTSLDFYNKDIPPIAYIKGIDLVTEGVITLKSLLQLSEKYIDVKDTSPKFYDKQDGASLLAEMLFEEATQVNFFVGQSVNIAHQGLTIDTTTKLKLIETLANNLKNMRKEVNVKYF